MGIPSISLHDLRLSSLPISPLSPPASSSSQLRVLLFGERRLFASTMARLGACSHALLPSILHQAAVAPALLALADNATILASAPSKPEALFALLDAFALTRGGMRLVRERAWRGVRCRAARGALVVQRSVPGSEQCTVPCGGGSRGRKTAGSRTSRVHTVQGLAAVMLHCNGCRVAPFSFWSVCYSLFSPDPLPFSLPSLPPSLPNPLPRYLTSPRQWAVRMCSSRGPTCRASSRALQWPAWTTCTGCCWRARRERRGTAQGSSSEAGCREC